MAQVAYPLLTLAVTGSATYAGVVGAVQMLAFTVSSAPAGVLADMYDRRRLIISCNLARASVLTLLAAALTAEIIPESDDR
jgi:MFS family permease